MRKLSGAGLAIGLIASSLSGCQSTLSDDNPAADRRASLVPALAAKSAPKPLSKVHFAGGDVVVSGPEGYCLDPKTIQNRSERGFALIASCNILSGGRLGPQVPAIMVSVTIGPRGSSDDVPRAADIARTTGARLVTEQNRDGLVLAQVEGGGDALADSRDPRQWRGAFALNGRLVGLALYVPRGSSFADAEGAAFLAATKALIVAQSARPNAPLAQNAKSKGLLAGLFKR